MRCQIRNKLGYTLIELLVVIAISSIFFVFTIAAYQSYNKSQNLKSAVAEIEVYLRDAQNRAMSGEKRSNVCISTGGHNYLLADWRFVWNDSDLGNKKYKVYGICFDNNDLNHQEREFPDAPDPKIILSLPSTDNVRFTNSGTVHFKPLAQGASFDDNPTLLQKSICIQGDSIEPNYYKITVYPSGDIVNEGKVIICP